MPEAMMGIEEIMATKFSTAVMLLLTPIPISLLLFFFTPLQQGTHFEGHLLLTYLLFVFLQPHVA